MKSFKKGIALIAVLAFLISAILPVSGLAEKADASYPQSSVIYGCPNNGAAAIPSVQHVVLNSSKWVKGEANSLPTNIELSDTIYAWAGSSIAINIGQSAAPAGTTPTTTASGSAQWYPNDWAWAVKAGGATSLADFDASSPIVGTDTSAGADKPVIWWTGVAMKGDSSDGTGDGIKLAPNDQGLWYMAVRYGAKGEDYDTATTADEVAAATDWYWQVYRVIPVFAELQANVQGVTSSNTDPAAASRPVTTTWSENESLPAQASWTYWTPTKVPLTDPSDPTSEADESAVQWADITSNLASVHMPIGSIVDGTTPAGTQLQTVLANWGATTANGQNGANTNISIGAAYPTGGIWNLPVYSVIPNGESFSATCIASNVYPNLLKNREKDSESPVLAAGSNENGTWTKIGQGECFKSAIARVPVQVNPGLQLVASLGGSVSSASDPKVTTNPVAYVGVGANDPSTISPKCVILNALTQPSQAASGCTFTWSVDGPNLAGNANEKPTLEYFGLDSASHRNCDTTSIALTPFDGLSEGTYTFTCIQNGPTPTPPLPVPAIAASIQVQVVKGQTVIQPDAAKAYVGQNSTNLNSPDGFTAGTMIDGQFTPYTNNVGQWNAVQTGTDINANGKLGITGSNLSQANLMPASHPIVQGDIGTYTLTYTLLPKWKTQIPAGTAPSGTAAVVYAMPPAAGTFYALPEEVNVLVGGKANLTGYIADGNGGGAPLVTTRWNLPTDGPEVTTWGDWNVQSLGQVSGPITRATLTVEPKAGLQNGTYTFTATDGVTTVPVTVIVGPKSGTGTISAAASREELPLGLSDTLTATYTPENGTPATLSFAQVTTKITDSTGKDVTTAFDLAAPAAVAEGTVVVTPHPGKVPAGTYRVQLSAAGGAAAAAGAAPAELTLNVVNGTVTVVPAESKAYRGFSRTFTALVNGEPVAATVAKNDGVWYAYAPGGTTPSANSLAQLGVAANSSDSTDSDSTGYVNPAAAGAARITVTPAAGSPTGSYKLTYTLVQTAGSETATLYGSGTLDVTGDIPAGTLFINPDQADMTAGAEVATTTTFSALKASGTLAQGTSVTGGTWSKPVNENGSDLGLGWDAWGQPYDTTEDPTGSTIRIRARETVPPGTYTLTYTAADGSTAEAIINVTNPTYVPAVSGELTVSAPDPAQVVYSNLQGLDTDAPTANMGFVAPNLSGKTNLTPADLSLKVTAGNAAFDIPGEQAYDAELVPQAVEITGENATAVLNSETGGIEVTVNAPEGITVTGNPVSYEPNLMSVSFDFQWDVPASKTRSGADMTSVPVTAGEHYDIIGKGDGLADTAEGSTSSESVTGGQYVITSSTPDAPTAEEMDAYITVKDGQLTFSFTMPEDVVDGSYVYDIGYKLRPNASFTLPVAEIVLNVTGGSGEPTVKVGDFQIQTDIPGEQATSPINLEIGEDYGLFAVVAADISADGEVTWDDAADDAGAWAVADESVAGGEANPYVSGGFTLTGLADGTTTVTYTVAETGQVFTFEVVVGSGAPAPGKPDPNEAGIVTGSGLLEPDQYEGEWDWNPFTYWTQPKAGLFADAESQIMASYPNAAVPVQESDPSGSLKDHFQIGPNDVAVSPVQGAAQPNSDLTLNKRIQVYYSPSNIAMPVEQADGTTKLEWLNNCNWSDYVTMEWEYKPSTKDEDDGNPLKIPAGFGFSGIRSPLLTISPLTENMDGWWVRLVVYPKAETGLSSELYWETRWIRLDIDGVNGALDPVVTITSNPEAVGSVTNVTRGGDAVFTANVSNQPYGSTLSYQWQSLAQPTAANPTPAWTEVAGANGQSLAVPNVTDAMSGVSYRCVVRCEQSGPGSLGTVNVSTNYLTLNVTAPDGSVYVTSSNPDGTKLIYKLISDTLQAQITAKTDNGDPVTYQWYVRSYLAPVPETIDTVAEAAAYLAGAASEEVPGATSANLTSEPLKEGVYAFRCRVENASNAAKAAFSPIIYVIVTKNQFEIYPAPGDIISAGVVNGQALTLKAWARATNVSYTWQRYNTASGQWTTLTATGQNLVLPSLTTEATGTLYRCAISTPGSTDPIYTGWYLVNVWDTANTPVITSTAQNLRWTLSQFENDMQRQQAAGNTSMPLLRSNASVAQDLNHGIGPVVAVWYSNTGSVVACSTFGNPVSAGLDLNLPAVSADSILTSTVTQTANGRYESTLSLDFDAVTRAPGECASAATIARALNGTYYCVWYKPQTVQEYCYQTEYTYDYLGDQNFVPVDMTNTHPGYMQLLAPQAVKGSTAIQIQIPGDPWIITDLGDTATVSVGSQATLSVAAAITQPSDTTTPVYTWQVSENADALDPVWRNCLSSDGTGQFTNTFTTRTITQDDYDTNLTLTYRVIVASRPNVAKIVSNECALQLTTGTPQAPVLTPGPGSPITIENGIATGITVSKNGTTVESFHDLLNMTVPAGYSVQVRGSDGQLLDADDVVYTGCILQLVNDDTDAVVDRATIIVMGDVLGNGIIGINQVVRMAQDLNGSRPLDGIYAQAGDFNGSGSIDIADLVHEAQILSEPIDVQK